jgi:hypothetical protein
MINIIKGVIATIQGSIADLQKAFTSVIVDKTYSLDERWEFFTEAPDWLTNHESDIIGFIDMCNKYKFGKTVIEHSIDKERGSAYTVDIVETLLEDLEYLKEKSAYTQEEIDILREDILAANLASFEIDW